MKRLHHRVLRTIRLHGLIAPGDRVAVAVSAGADSVALSWLLHDLAGDLDATLAWIIHVNHGLRGDEALRDEVYCRDLASRLGVPIEVARVDVRAAAIERKISLESAARDLRYGCFIEAAASRGAARIATGHTLDDQAETVLLRLLRGTGGRGLSGVRVARGPFIRPLLECRRADLRSYLAARGETACEDSSNADRSIPRNRIRHELLPVIEHLAPGGIPALARAAALAADDERFLTQTAIASASSVVLLDSDGVQLKCEPLSALPPAVARRVVRLAIERVSTRGRLAARHIEALRRLASRIEPFGHIDLPGATVERRADRLVVRAGRMKAPAAFHRELTLPGETRLAGVDVDSVETRVEARFQDGVDLATLASRDPWQVVIQADAVALPLVARSRRPGDRLKPLGAPGRRKLQDVFVDRKVPRSTRDQVPVIVDSTGRLVWVVGVAMADECRVTAPEAKVIILTVRNT